MTNSADKQTYLRQIRKLILSDFLGNLYFFLPILTLFLLDNDISLSVIVLAQVAYSATSFIAEIPTGILADRYGHKLSYAIGRLSDALGLLVIVLFPTPITLFLGLMFRGLSGALMSGSEDALLYEYSKRSDENFTKQLGRKKGLGTLGFAVAALVAGVAVEVFGTDAYAPLIFLTITFIVASSYQAITLLDLKISNKGKDKFHEVKQGFALIKTNKVLRTLIIVSGITFLGKYTLIDVYPPYFVENNVAPLFIGLSLSLGAALNYLLLRSSQTIEDKLGPVKSITGTVLVTAALYVLLGITNNAYITVVTFVLLFAVMESKAVFVSSYANEHARSDIRATILSAVSQFKELIKILVKTAFGFAVGVFSLSSLFIIYGSVLAVGAAWGYFLLRKADR